MTRESAAPSRLFLWTFVGLACVVIAWAVILAFESEPRGLPRSEVSGQYLLRRTVTDAAELDTILDHFVAWNEAIEQKGVLPAAHADEWSRQLEEARAIGSARVTIDVALRANGYFLRKASLAFGELESSSSGSGEWRRTAGGVYLGAGGSGTPYDLAEGVLTYPFCGLTFPLERRPYENEDR